MSDPNRALSEVPSLLEERRKYETWISALDARRESTPAHVYQRVHDDYRSRLKRVEEQLTAHRGALETERANAESRLGQIRREEHARHDERAELDLRVQVGELSAAEASPTIRSLDDSLSQLTREREQLDAKIATFGKLLGGSVAEPSRPVPPEPRATTTGGAFDELAFLSSVVEAERSSVQPASAPPAAAAPTMQASTTQAPASRAPTELPPLSPKLGDIQDRDLEALAPRDEGGASLLTGVTGAAPVVTHDSTASEGLLRDLPPRSETPASEGKRATGAAPLTSRQTATAEQPKTLKCTECGAMNYPTEWYCERCGAELAAL